ncbi:ABC transporter ATP-binding protein [Pseudooceanicola aestuarii]|uniref:ABC transporter ATP-binding protein n=1 Tax=Pseudooceanicola aestuarii TaxID=2697319 RepID=UPI0013D5F196|nr:ABC transporter ATP-binding protein [Pseudooceanicola aestuarii]
MEFLSLRDLKIEYKSPRGQIRAVDGISFEVPRGKVVGVVGESGCGKTTAVRAITGVMPSVASFAGGEIVFKGENLIGLDKRRMRELQWRQIAYVPQSAMNALDPVWRVGKQLEEVLVKRGGYTWRDARTRAAELFDMVGLEVKRLADYPHQFSGGMRQRASIALALALDPDLVIADEPVTALDVVIQRQVLDTLKRLQEELTLSVLLVTHDISVVAYVCDYVVVMYAGQIVEQGPVHEVLTAPSHPYTIGLYNAFPELTGDDDQELTPIEGSPPDLLNPPSGCRFRARCPFATDGCKAEQPQISVGAGHQALCHRAPEAAQLRDRARHTETWTGVAAE